MKMTTKEIADLIGVDERTIRNWISGIKPEKFSGKHFRFSEKLSESEAQKKQPEWDLDEVRLIIEGSSYPKGVIQSLMASINMNARESELADKVADAHDRICEISRKAKSLRERFEDVVSDMRPLKGEDKVKLFNFLDYVIEAAKFDRFRILDLTERGFVPEKRFHLTHNPGTRTADVRALLE